MSDPGSATRRRSARVHATVVEDDGTRRRRAEQLAGEEPLEIRVAAPGGTVVARTSTMRTPGQDFALAAGLLHAEGVIAGPDDLAEVRYCTDVDDQNYNVVTVHLRRPPRRDLGERTLPATASCGVCGTASIDELADRLAPVPPTGTPFEAATLAALPEALRHAQPLFDTTGGLHAAALADGATGRLLVVHEDIGRHNAVDKVIGDRLLAGALPAPGSAVLVLSGRVSFELVQKAAAAGVAAICAISAPSSLAVTTADRLGITLAGFVRGGRMTLYTHPQRVSSSALQL